MSIPAVTHSVICTQWLMSYIGCQYPAEPVNSVRLLQRRVSDTYLVTTSTRKFILRIYRANLRTREQIEAELIILEHVRSQGCITSTALADRQGTFIHQFNAPEGSRFAVLFEYLEGESLESNRIDNSTMMQTYGAMVANLHNALDHLTQPLTRPELTIDWMLNHPVENIRSYLEGLKKYHHDLKQYQQWLDGYLGGIQTNTLNYGLIHGDLLPANCLLYHNDSSRPSRHIATLDFDFCGYGLRAYDLAAFIHDQCFLNGNNVHIDSYLSGYAKIRPFDSAFLQLVKALLPVRGIWFLGLWAANSHDWGNEYLRDKKMLNRHLNYIRSLIHQCLTNKP